MAPWWRLCLACLRPWLPLPGLKEGEKGATENLVLSGTGLGSKDVFESNKNLPVWDNKVSEGSEQAECIRVQSQCVLSLRTQNCFLEQ